MSPTLRCSIIALVVLIDNSYVLAVVSQYLAPMESTSGVEKSLYGVHPNGENVYKFTLRNKIGGTVEVISYGATLTRLIVPDKFGQPVDVVLGADTLSEYVGSTAYMGATIGRVANRIAKGHFSLNGIEYQLAINNPPNHLHGGLIGFDKKIWKFEIANVSNPAVVFSLSSPDGDENYPGTVSVRVEYSLSLDSNQLKIEVTATTDKATPISITNHAYFNLEGEGTKDVFGHQIQINSDRYLPEDANHMVTGEIRTVEGSPFDFRKAANLGERLATLGGTGFNANFCFDSGGPMKHYGSAYAPKTGIEMNVRGTPPGLQFYTAYYMDQVGKAGKHYGRYSAFCMELQRYPDAVNQPKFPSVILQPNDTYRETLMYSFSVR